MNEIKTDRTAEEIRSARDVLEAEMERLEESKRELTTSIRRKHGEWADLCTELSAQLCKVGMCFKQEEDNGTHYYRIKTIEKYDSDKHQFTQGTILCERITYKVNHYFHWNHREYVGEREVIEHMEQITREEFEEIREKVTELLSNAD